MTLALAATVALGTFAAAFVQGLSGFGFGLIAMSLWTWTVDPHLAAPLVVWGSWIGQLLSLRAVRGPVNWRPAVPFVLGGVIGVPLGAWLLGFVDARMFRGFVGAMLVIYCPAMLALRHRRIALGGPKAFDGTAGLIGGVMGGLGGLTGPAPTLWCTLRGWDKDTQRSVFQVFNIAMHSLTLTVYALDGTWRPSMLPLCALMVPVAILPTLAGARLYRRFSDIGFRTLVLILLLASGITLLISTYLG